MPLTIPPRSERPYELLVWGATGFTGQLVAQFIAGTTGRSALVDGDGTGSAKKKLRWALGGRSETKLNKVKLQLMQRLNNALVEEPAIILADSDDQQSLQRMTAQTRVVISTVGPFSLYGEPLVASCCKTGTDYVDITGECDA
jgi:saccharopine dehydrogenase (NAD+, L-glutamate forming)